MKVSVTSNQQAVYRGLIRKLSAVGATNAVARAAALDTLARMRVRIFTKGQNSAGGQIGQYSRRKQPFWWFTPANTPTRFRARLKPFARKTKNGNVYYDVVNHAQVREIVGRQTNFVDLEFTGEMRGNLLPLPGPTRQSFAIGFTNPKMAERAGFNEARYGSIFYTTAGERTAARAAAFFEIQRILKS